MRNTNNIMSRINTMIYSTPSRLCCIKQPGICSFPPSATRFRVRRLLSHPCRHAPSHSVRRRAGRPSLVSPTLAPDSETCPLFQTATPSSTRVHDVIALTCRTVLKPARVLIVGAQVEICRPVSAALFGLLPPHTLHLSNLLLSHFVGFFPFQHIVAIANTGKPVIDCFASFAPPYPRSSSIALPSSASRMPLPAPGKGSVWFDLIATADELALQNRIAAYIDSLPVGRAGFSCSASSFS